MGDGVLYVGIGWKVFWWCIGDGKSDGWCWDYFVEILVWSDVERVGM